MKYELHITFRLLSSCHCTGELGKKNNNPLMMENFFSFGCQCILWEARYFEMAGYMMVWTVFTLTRLARGGLFCSKFIFSSLFS